MNWLRNLWKVRFYAAFALLTYGGFVWAGLSGNRWLGSDDENQENLNGSSGHARSSGGRATYFHK
ncbi:hypothetical protein [Hymenobacter weizhouensis]|uniref:hypothetical protein n=1 Tax=Hymenobacter sp. YIM 151500-1 TaxID=2987689 RepID=UPI0022277D19|nr:hypothetical protein [Hymenobacter sp. YIM 151500-1]UYZ64962.1 hypothetical protein OIS53_08945 [Hymenobacter sp. YIM 151500-1]